MPSWPKTTEANANICQLPSPAFAPGISPNKVPSGIEILEVKRGRCKAFTAHRPLGMIATANISSRMFHVLHAILDALDAARIVPKCPRLGVGFNCKMSSQCLDWHPASFGARPESERDRLITTALSSESMQLQHCCASPSCLERGLA